MVVCRNGFRIPFIMYSFQIGRHRMRRLVTLLTVPVSDLIKRKRRSARRAHVVSTACVEEHNHVSSIT
jgi:hypothetical protein